MTLRQHLETGATTVCRAWALERRDGQIMGFTDHDGDLAFDGIIFRARSGMTAHAIEQGTGLAVDNAEGFGALSDEGLTEADILAGRYDGANVRIWQVNWASVEERRLIFQGSLGEISRQGGAFRAELRGLTEVLNQPQGRVFQRGCAAVLGDGQCRFDLTRPGYAAEVPLSAARDTVLQLPPMQEFDDRWFEGGRLRVLSGPAAGLIALVKNDRRRPDGREIVLWQALGTAAAAGDLVRLEAGCDKRAETCRLKFNNFLNFRGFPHIPGEDWLMSYPTSAGHNDGGSLFR
ncbi:DUF2163 domain-containing protein [Plastorhodobacter daqingensis]|uniref:DUF2163 domain-containing protein n=1 Tax=Plastorhodobacter daqingensis TaxID=1387281 RepID=A0ABW2UM22_9RHOB